MPCLAEAGPVYPPQPLVRPMTQHPHLADLRGNPLGQIGRPVAAPVVDDHDLTDRIFKWAARARS